MTWFARPKGSKSAKDFDPDIHKVITLSGLERTFILVRKLKTDTFNLNALVKLEKDGLCEIAQLGNQYNESPRVFWYPEWTTSGPKTAHKARQTDWQRNVGGFAEEYRRTHDFADVETTIRTKVAGAPTTISPAHQRMGQILTAIANYVDIGEDIGHLQLAQRLANEALGRPAKYQAGGGRELVDLLFNHPDQIGVREFPQIVEIYQVSLDNTNL